ncbi:Hypothetical predicted protein [Scomber scombrus]|uniref:Uncharacterized protein n=1 Tax=Scomber scombrus TaxID=13677 RepID=A0AAV1PHC6_SCOSC
MSLSAENTVLHNLMRRKTQRGGPRPNEAFGYDSERLTSNRQQDMISYFPRAALTQIQLSTYYFLMPEQRVGEEEEEEVAHEKENSPALAVGAQM